jgi:hypothetical protein
VAVWKASQQSRYPYSFDFTIPCKSYSLQKENAMREKLRSLVVLSLVFSLVSYTSVRASSNPEEDAKAATKVKSAPAELHTGPDARVETKLLDKAKLKGYLSELNDDQFMAAKDRAGAVTRIAHPQFQKGMGRNHLTGDTVLAIVILAVLLAVIGGQVIAHHGDF